MPFMNAIRIEPVSERGLRTEWRVCEPLNFYSSKRDKNYIVPAGTLTDLASGIVAAASAAAILHDHLYSDGLRLKQIADRAEADDVFFEAMLDSGVPLWRCWAYFLAVRTFGWIDYEGRKIVKNKMLGLLLVAALLPLTGCARWFVAETEVVYIVTTPDGVRTEARYRSGKDQQGLTATVAGASFTVDKAGTPEAAITAAMESHRKLSEFLSTLAPLLLKAAAVGASGGAAAPLVVK